MTTPVGGDRTTSAVLAWCDWYTRGLPDDVAAERRDELAADLHDHRLDAMRRDEVDGRHARAVVARALLGAPADLSWRSHQLRIARSARRQEKQMSVASRRDGRTTVAYVLGGLVVAWSVLNVAMLWNLVSVSSNDEDRRWGLAIGLTGLVCLGLSAWALTALTRRPRAAGAALAVSAVLTTVWITWFLWLAAVGVGIAAFFVLYAVRATSETSDTVAA
jgi:hypothetical protein